MESRGNQGAKEIILVRMHFQDTPKYCQHIGTQQVLWRGILMLAVDRWHRQGANKCACKCELNRILYLVTVPPWRLDFRIDESRS